MRRRAPILLVLAALAAPVSVLAQGQPYEIHADRPLLGDAATGEVVQGRVYVREPETRRYRRFRGGLLLMGSYVDATRGRLRITVAAGPSTRRTWSSVFYSGRFHLSQESESPYVTTLRLVGGDFDACETTATAAATRKRKRVRRLWGDGKGRFRTRGRHSAATVRGTKWLVADDCEGTLTVVRRGEVEVEDFAAAEASQEGQAPPSTGGGGAGSQPSPAAGPGADTRGTPRRVRVRSGGRYRARPRG